MNEIITTIANEFFTKMGITIESLVVLWEDEERRIYRVELQTPDSKLLIGIHGQTLECITHLLSRMVEETHGKSALLHVEINDYLKAKDERLFKYIDGRIAEAIRTTKEVILSDLTSYERKKVHSYIQSKNIKNLRSWSVGEKSERRMHLLYEKNSLSELEEDSVGI